MVRASLVPLFLVCCGLTAQTPAPSGMRLSLQEAIQISLKNNLQVDIARQARESTVSGIQTNLGAFDWGLTADAAIGKQDFSNSTTPADGTTKKRTFDVGLAKAFTWGGNFSVNYGPAYSSTDGTSYGTPYTTTNPWSGTLSATYSQALLQGFGRQITMAPLIIARKSAQAADYTFQQSIISLVASTESQYWDLVYAERFLASKKTSLELAQKQLRENTIRMQVGTMAPIDVTSAEAQVAQAEQDIISAEAALANAKDALVRSLFPNAERPASLETTDAPTLGHIQLDEAGAVKMALDRRVELKSARIAKENAEINAKVYENKLLPSLSAYATYNGQSDVRGSYGTVNSDLTGFKYPGYTVGVKFAMPIQNNTAKGNLSAARAGLRSSELSLKDQELSIILQVRQNLRNVEAMEKAVKAAEKTRYYQQKNLEAEQKKFENGMSTNFVVLQVMTNLDNARSAELQAQINYAKAVTALEQAVGNLLEARNLKVQ
ncbi:TolC family protein [Mesoterricola sediminis]|uniref:RND transporter n=1 Tax=Mesoterricola sediminis TaxID=2927980 RepID=A0AA48GY69_9BACT|nr:TolC family protein [Mesoterricola sediminis]BDU76575.1 RND transporter [Mesoterricola sediminis]